jgi:hypothetical protein
MPDNRPEDKHYYQLIIVTGHRRHAGTKSKVITPSKTTSLVWIVIVKIQLIVAGEDDQTEVRTLIDRTRPILQRGSIDSFIMAVPKYVWDGY